jgi:hypothetical protein
MEYLFTLSISILRCRVVNRNCHHISGNIKRHAMFSRGFTGVYKKKHVRNGIVHLTQVMWLSIYMLIFE